MEIKRICRQYFFSLILVLCIVAFLLGVITVREKTDYNMRMTPYDTVEIKENKEGIIFLFGENGSFTVPDFAAEFKKSLSKGLNCIF